MTKNKWKQENRQLVSSWFEMLSFSIMPTGRIVHENCFY